MNRIHKLSILITAMGLFSVANANAELIIDDSDNPTQSAPAQVTPPAPVFSSNTSTVVASVVLSSNTTQEGTPIVSAPVQGWANDLSLSTALKQIVPDGWRAKKVGAVDLNKKVSWKGGKPWINILDSLAVDNGFKANVDWTTKTLTISSSSIENKVANPTPYNVSTTSKPVFSETTTTTTASPSAYSDNETWLLDHNKTLKENIQDWATKAGWTVSWDAPDYRIIADVTLTGKIDSTEGPIARIIAAYKDAQQPLIAKISEGNKVIRIESRNYNQETVVEDPLDQNYSSMKVN